MVTKPVRLDGSLPFFVATSNEGKLREIIPLVHEFFPDVQTIQGRAAKVAEETASSFTGNAEIKARALASEIGSLDCYILADDSGLEVEALGGQPGLLSARYAGDHVDPQAHMQKLLQELDRVPGGSVNRRARYVCALALLENRQGRVRCQVSEGYCYGSIAPSPNGDSGFGYDPIFIAQDLGKSLGELPYEAKDKISHRRRAFEALVQSRGPVNGS